MFKNVSAKEKDLELLHRHNLLTPTAVLVADNVLSTAAVGLLWRTGRGKGICQSTVLRQLAMPTIVIHSISKDSQRELGDRT